MMLIRNILFWVLFFTTSTSIMAQGENLRHEILMETTSGNMRIMLYDETPLHRDNFLRLVREGFYDGCLFHRVIRNFMIQTGDSSTRHARQGDLIGLYSLDYSIPAEIDFPARFHRRGALAMARESDNVNPKRESSATQFYIVYGDTYTDASLDKAQRQLDKSTGGAVKLPPEVRKVYQEVGGAPYLDGQYTVFGEVVEGLDVLGSIQNEETDKNNRPVKDVRILKMSVIK